MSFSINQEWDITKAELTTQKRSRTDTGSAILHNQFSLVHQSFFYIHTNRIPSLNVYVELLHKMLNHHPIAKLVIQLITVH